MFVLFFGVLENCFLTDHGRNITTATLVGNMCSSGEC